MEQPIKVYPHSTEAEEAVLGGIIKEGSSIFERCNAWIRDEEAFYHTKNKELWKILAEMHREGEVIDLVTLGDRIKSSKLFSEEGLNLYYISGLPDSVVTTGNVESYARIIWEKHIKRKSIKSAYELYNTGFKESEEKVEDLLHNHAILVNELLEISPSKKKDISSVINETIDTLKTGKNIIKFGYPQLDNIAGGMTRKELTVIG